MARSVVLVLSLAPVAQGAETRWRYPFRHYDDAQGLGNLTVTSLVQDRDGFLWVGTQDGLYRFDGQRFARFATEEGLPSRVVDSLYLGRDGTLWVGTDLGLARRAGDRFAAIAPDQGPAAEILAIGEDGQGRVFVGLKAGLKLARGGRLVAAPVAWPGRVDALTTATDGSLWIAGNKLVGHVQADHLELLGAAEGLPDEAFDAIVMDPKGELLLRSAAHLVALPPGSRRFQDRTRGLPPSNSFGSLYVDQAGDLRVPTDFGLARRLADGSFDVVGQSRGLVTDAVLAVLEDREGLIWVGLAGGGLACWLGYPAWTAVTAAEGLNNDAVWAVGRDARGDLVAGTDKGLNRLDPRTGRWRAWGREDGLGGDCAYVLLPGEGQELWIGLYPGGITRQRADGSFEHYAKAEGLGGLRVNGLARSADGALWAGTTRGLYLARTTAGGARFENQPLPGGDPTEPIYGVLADRRGRIWVGGKQGLALREPGVPQGRGAPSDRGQAGWRRIGANQGLRSEQIGFFAEAPDGSMWLGYWEPQGVVHVAVEAERLRVIEHLDHASGLASDSVQALTVDGRGRIWIGTSRGVHVLDGGRLRHYGRADGLIWNNVDSLHVDASGEVWIATSRGLAHFSPGPTRLLPPPRVTLLDVRLGGRAAADGVAVGPDESTLEVSFAGLTFRKPEDVRFRYRLLGFEDSPTETPQREARYPRLPPGEYVLEVSARNDEGTWSVEPARFRFRVRPPWYLTPVATSGFVLLAGGLGFLGYRARVRQLLEARRRLEEAVAARTAELQHEKQRVEEQARALVEATEERRRVYAMVVHDLKNPLTPLLGGLDFLAEGLRPEFRAGFQALETMRQAARRMLFLIESYTQTLRATSVEGSLQFRGFPAADLLADLALSYAPSTLRRGLTLSVGGAPVDDRFAPARGGVLADAPADRVYRALENILGNALKYAHSEIRLSLEERDGRIGFVVWNDGPSIPEAEREQIFGLYRQAGGARPGTGVGLASARRLLEEVGGEVRLVEPGSGVQFEVWVPQLEAQAA